MANEKELILKRLQDYVNIGLKPRLGSSFLLPDGRFINLGITDVSHGDIVDYLQNEDIFLYDDFTEFMADFEAVRLNSGENLFETPYLEITDFTPTNDQYTQLENWLYLIYNKGTKQIDVTVDFENKIYSFADYLPEDIIKKIKRCISSGKLYEGVEQPPDDFNEDEVLEIADKAMKYFYGLDTNSFLDYLGYRSLLKDSIDPSSAMFLLPNGKILSVEDALKKFNIKAPSYHVNLFLPFIYSFYRENGYTDKQIDYIINEYDISDELSFEDEVTYNWNWARLNCGGTQFEARFYCTLPEKLTSDQYDTLEKWLDWGLSNNREQVKIFAGEEVSFLSYPLEDPDYIIKRIKRYYSSGTLYETLEGNQWYHGTSYKREWIKQFNQPINWFTKDYNYAKSYVTMFGSNGYIYKCELNNKSPIYCGETSVKVFEPLPIEKPYKFTEEFLFIMDQLGIGDEQARTLIENVKKEQLATNKYYEYKLVIDIVTRTKAFREFCINSGFDSVCTKEKGRECVGIFYHDDIKVIGRKQIG